MSEQRPLTITASEFVAGDYAAKIARGECVVSDPVGDVIIGNWIGNEDYIWLTWEDKHGIKGNSGYTYTVPLTVEWLPQPEREEAAARELADGWRDAEIARLQAEVARLREALGQISSNAPDSFPNPKDFLNIGNCGVAQGHYSMAVIARIALATANSEPDHK